MKITDTLTKKIGPLPVWGWGVIGAAGIWVARSLMGSIPGAARVSSSGAEVGYGSSSGGGLPGSFAPEPAIPYAPDPLSFGTPGGGFISGPVGGVLDLIGLLPPGFFFPPPADASPPTYVAPYVPPAPAPAPYVPPPTTKRYGLRWTNQPGVYVGFYATRLEASLAAQAMDPNGAAWAGINPATGKPYPGSNMTIDEI